MSGFREQAMILVHNLRNSLRCTKRHRVTITEDFVNQLEDNAFRFLKRNYEEGYHVGQNHSALADPILLYSFTISDTLNLSYNEIWQRANNIFEEEAQNQTWPGKFYLKLRCEVRAGVYQFDVMQGQPPLKATLPPRKTVVTPEENKIRELEKQVKAQEYTIQQLLRQPMRDFDRGLEHAARHLSGVADLLNKRILLYTMLDKLINYRYYNRIKLITGALWDARDEVRDMKSPPSSVSNQDHVTLGQVQGYNFDGSRPLRTK